MPKIAKIEISEILADGFRFQLLLPTEIIYISLGRVFKVVLEKANRNSAGRNSIAEKKNPQLPITVNF